MASIQTNIDEKTYSNIWMYKLQIVSFQKMKPSKVDTLAE